jgi:hydroxymethylbilane synthase
MTAKIPDRVVIATRGSDLARWQSNWIAKQLRTTHPGLEVELRIYKTVGDRDQAASLQVIGGKGAFTKEITEAVLRGEADVAVHSLKDLPTDPVPGLRVWAHPGRLDLRDAWIGRDDLSYQDLEEGSVVATGSLRRRAQVLSHHPGISVEDIRGNVDTRLRKFREGSMAGMFLAMAGLIRLGFDDRVTEALEPGRFLPAPGQGALAVEGREDEPTEALLSPLDDMDCRVAVTAERSLLAVLEAGCQVPVGAWARLEDGDLVLDGLVASLDGIKVIRSQERGSPDRATEIGKEVAARLIEGGGGEILASIREAEGPGE